MAQNDDDDDVSSVTSDDSYDSEEEDQPRKILYKRFTDSQRRRLEKAFKKHQYLSFETRENLASRTQLSTTQVQTWFVRQRFKWRQQQEKKKLVEKIKKYTRKIYALENKFDSERIKSTNLNKQLDDLRYKYDDLVYRKRKIAKELEEKCSTISYLKNKVRRLTDSNERLKEKNKDLHHEVNYKMKCYSRRLICE